jgi:8-oxo-dGTP pyrophosphatase MutT (NUDIX family)
MNYKRYVGVVIKHDGRFLICKRNPEGMIPGMWSIPAGKIEDGEDVKTAAQREFFEETAININDQELKFLGMIPRYSRDGKRMKGLMYVYMVEAERAMNPDLDEAIDGQEHTECGYFTVEDMKPLAIDAFLYKLFEFISE